MTRQTRIKKAAEAQKVSARFYADARSALADNNPARAIRSQVTGASWSAAARLWLFGTLARTA